mgnify:CR=1 FL=1
MTTAVAEAQDAHDEHHGPEKGIRRWLFTTNHKDIGTMYLIFSLVMFFTGGAMAMVIRSELAVPGLQFVDPGFAAVEITRVYAGGYRDLRVILDQRQHRRIGLEIDRDAQHVFDAGIARRRNKP